MEPMEQKFQELLQTVYEIHDLGAAAGVLGWDQSTYMPFGGAEARARQLATLQRLGHERFASPALGRLLDELQPYEERAPYDSFEASLLRVTRREYQRWQRVPPAFVARFAEVGAQTYQTWMKARPDSDFAAVQPWLERMLDHSRELSSYLSPNGHGHVADPLIDISEVGLGTDEIRRIFSALRAELVPLVETITARSPTDDDCLRQHFPEASQLAFCRALMERLGYDFQRGRVDKSAHPYMTRFSTGDVRITTRVRENFLGECLFSTTHETGHALYEQGVDPALERTPLAGGASSGVHESQSRLWENLVARSRGFWEYWYPQLQQAFPAQLDAVPLDAFYRAINKVERSLIRTDADEVTYNLHVMLRFDLEIDMLEGRLPIRDLPEAWNARMHSDLELVPPNDALGAMQDIHWYWGMIGGSFQGYTLGNIMSAQIFEAALAAHPEIPTDIAAGEYGTLRGWLTERLYRHGAKFTPPELIERVTGQPLTIEPYMRYLRSKYAALYSF